MDSTLARWRGRAAFVTGGSTGIGRATAEELGRLGLRVAVSGRRPEPLEAVVAAIRNAGGEALALAGDHRDPAFVTACFAELSRRWQGVDVLVNNVAALGGRSLLRAPWTEIEAALDLNLRSTLLALRLAADQFRGRDEGAVVTISSMASTVEYLA